MDERPKGTVEAALGEPKPGIKEFLYWRARPLMERPLSKAQRRALLRASREGALDNHQGRWAPPSRVRGLSPDEAVAKPYEQSGTVFALQVRGYLMPDPAVPQGAKPRPRVITERGLDQVRKMLG